MNFRRHSLRWIFAALLGIAIWDVAFAQERTVVVEPSATKKTWAVVIGIEQYQVAPRLGCSVRDAEMFAETLTTVGQVKSENILQVTDKTALKPNCETLSRQIATWLAKPGGGDTLLFFFSGHGLWNSADGRMYLATSDTRLDDIEHTSLGIARLREQLSHCQAANKILILDCCHSGAIKGGALDGEKLTKAFDDIHGVVTLASCKGNQVSLEWKDKHQGLFSYWLIRGLRGEADLVPDGKIDIDEIYRFVTEKVPQSAVAEFGVKQTPVRSVLPDVEGVPTILLLAGVAHPGTPQQPVVASQRPSASEPVSHTLHEAFHDAQVGALPKGWSGDPVVGIRREAEQSCLQAAAGGMHRVQSPELAVSGDFRLELRVSLEDRAKFDVTLEGMDGSPDLAIAVTVSMGNARCWRVSMSGATAQDIKVPDDRPNRIRLNRDGEVCQLIVNDKVLIAQRMPEHRQFRRLSFSLSGPNAMSYIHSVARLLQVELTSPGS